MDPKLAAAIVEGIVRATPRQSGSSSISILATVTALGFTLLTVVFSWFMFEASQQRSDLRAAIEANRDRIETLLEERLPPRR